MAHVYMVFRWYDAPAPISQPHRTHCLVVLACKPPLRIASQPPTVLPRAYSTCCVIKGVFTQHTSLIECHRSSTRHETEAHEHYVLSIHVTAFREYNSNALLHSPSHWRLPATQYGLHVSTDSLQTGASRPTILRVTYTPRAVLPRKSFSPPHDQQSWQSPTNTIIIYHSACIAQYMQSIVNNIHQAPPHLYHHPASSINSHSNNQPADRPLSASISLYLPSPIVLKDSHLRELQPFATSSLWHQHKASVYTIDMHHRHDPYRRNYPYHIQAEIPTSLRSFLRTSNRPFAVRSLTQADLNHASHSVARCHDEIVPQTTPKTYNDSGFGTPSRFNLVTSSPQVLKHRHSQLLGTTKAERPSIHSRSWTQKQRASRIQERQPLVPTTQQDQVVPLALPDLNRLNLRGQYHAPVHRPALLPEWKPSHRSCESSSSHCADRKRWCVRQEQLHVPNS